MIVVLLGKSCSGKDTLARQLEKQGFSFVVSTTSRPMREVESQGNPYHFVTDSEFEWLIENDFLIEHREYNTLVDGIPATWYYGVEKSAIDPEKDYVVVLDMVGLRGFKEAKFDNIVSVYIKADDELRRSRCINRGDFNLQEWHRRLEDDSIVFSNSEVNANIDFVIDSNDESLQSVLGIIDYVNIGTV